MQGGTRGKQKGRIVGFDSFFFFLESICLNVLRKKGYLVYIHISVCLSVCRSPSLS